MNAPGNRSLALRLAISTVIGLGGTAAQADTLSINFEEFAVGSPDGQFGLLPNRMTPPSA